MNIVLIGTRGATKLILRTREIQLASRIDDFNYMYYTKWHRSNNRIFYFISAHHQLITMRISLEWMQIVQFININRIDFYRTLSQLSKGEFKLIFIYALYATFSLW